ncbi:insulin-like growth factor-binding protein complex acid labile subunit [Anopheles albimanus]|uniref:insulin-like growth factor-binding protein complex acid labile subunit n=1 Tax=Anopheles albimanus TaxID=7167 RepID=UPI00163EB5A7|nr:insulin-like growth factor-binding protein complex acid labile subunit [Anopheles albimanus]
MKFIQMWTKGRTRSIVTVCLLLSIVGTSVCEEAAIAAEEGEPQAQSLPVPVSHLCNFTKPLLDPTETEDDGYCICNTHNGQPWGIPVVEINCRNRLLTHIFVPGVVEQLPQGTVRLDLSHRELTDVPWLAGSSLHYLHLDHNAITTVPDKVFANLSSLLELHLSGNRIEVLSTDALAGLAMLKLLDLSHNRLRAIELNAFSVPIHLERLILSNNTALGVFFNRTGESDLFLRLGVTTRLATIELERCNLTDISLTNGAGLERALLGHNRFQQLAQLPKQLTHLDVSGTPIRSLPPKFLPYLLHLDTLIMQDMPTLVMLEAYSLYGLPRLSYLNLQGSRNLTTIHGHLFGQNVVRNETTDAGLKRLVLAGTSIRTLNDSLQVAFESLRVLDLRGAPLYCDCKLRWLREMRNLTTTAMCLKPSSLRRAPFGLVQPHQFECRSEQSWVYTVFNVILGVLLVVGVGVGIYLIVRAIRPGPQVVLRRVGETSPYARVTIEPNLAENL